MRYVVSVLLLILTTVVAPRLTTAQTPPAQPTPIAPPVQILSPPGGPICNAGFSGGKVVAVTTPFGIFTADFPPGDYNVGGGISDPGGPFTRVCHVQTNSAVFFDISGRESSRVGSNPDARPILDQIARTAVFQARDPSSLPAGGPRPASSDTGIRYFAVVYDSSGQFSAPDGTLVNVHIARQPGDLPLSAPLCLSLPVTGGRIDFTVITASCPESNGASLVFIDYPGDMPPLMAVVEPRLIEWRRAYVNEGPKNITIRPAPPSVVVQDPNIRPPTNSQSAQTIVPPDTGDAGLR